MATDARQKTYKDVTEQIQAILTFEPKIDSLAILMMGLSNVSSLLFYALNKEADPNAQLQTLPVNWTGFYLMTSATKLTLGPFQGKVACMQIQLGKGVCGTAVLQRKTQVVPDVHALPNHISCDSESESEIVVPIRQNGQVVAVLDIDSTHKGHFQPEDAAFLEAICEILSAKLTFPSPIPHAKLGTADKPGVVPGGVGAVAPGRVGQAPIGGHFSGTGVAGNKVPPEIKEKVTGGWRFTASKLPRMADAKVLSGLETQLKVCALPEIIFDLNSVTALHEATGLQLRVSAADALKAAVLHYNSDAFPKRKDEVLVPTSNTWKEKQKTHQIFDPKIDWAFRCDFKGEWTQAGSPAKALEAVPLAEAQDLINWDELKDTKLQMMLFDSFQLFDDDLHDHGLSQLSVKFRVMESCFFFLVHHFLRLDGQMVMIQDTRFYHHFGDDHVIVQRQDKRKDLPSEEQTQHGPRPSAPNDNDELAKELPVIREEYFTMSLK